MSLKFNIEQVANSILRTLRISPIQKSKLRMFKSLHLMIMEYKTIANPKPIYFKNIKGCREYCV